MFVFAARRLDKNSDKINDFLAELENDDISCFTIPDPVNKDMIAIARQIDETEMKLDDKIERKIYEVEDGYIRDFLNSRYGSDEIIFYKN